MAHFFFCVDRRHAFSFSIASSTDLLVYQILEFTDVLALSPQALYYISYTHTVNVLYHFIFCVITLKLLIIITLSLHQNLINKIQACTVFVKTEYKLNCIALNLIRLFYYLISPYKLNCNTITLQLKLHCIKFDYTILALGFRIQQSNN